MSGVKNLRAMFEQKNTDTSPPDRGRSPGPGLPSFGSPTPPSRPLSKVRTNFIAVEKDGRMGLQRQNSGDSASVSSRRLSNETENTTPAPGSEKNDVFTDTMATNVASFKTNLASETIPESPRQASPAKLSPTRGSNQTPDITPCPNPDKIVDEEESKTKLTPADPTVKGAVNGTSNGLNGTAEPKDKPKNTSSAGKPALKAAAPITTSSKTASKTTRSPLAAKSPKSPAKETAKPSEKKPAPTAARDSAPKTATAKPAASSGKKPGALDLSPTTGFVKPKPKSPTRPVNLPSRLTAPTTASASKLGSGAPQPRQSLSRASGNLGVPATAHRPTSRASATTATTATAASTGKTLKRQASTISRARPSLGPPPKLQAKDHPPTRKEATHVDEGFLARMMRPTQASSSKTSDKAPITPPRKQSGPSATRKTPSKDVEGSAKKLAAKIAEPAKKESTIKKPVVAKTEVKKVAPVAAPKSAQPTAKEVAPVVAQVATADAAVEVAKSSKDTAVAPVVEKQEAEPAEAATTTPPGTPPKAQPESVKEPDTELTQPTEVAKPESEEPIVSEEPETLEGEKTNDNILPAGTEDTAPQSSEEPKTEVGGEAKEIVTPTNDEPKVEEVADVDETVPSSSEEPKIEEAADTKEDEVVLEEKEVTSTDKHSVPAVAADPEKVEDIEDVVQKSTEQPVEKSD